MTTRRFVVRLLTASGAWLALWSAGTQADITLSQNPIWRAAGSYPTGVGWADINGDGWLDLVVTHGLDVTTPPDVIYFNSEGQLSGTPGWTSDEREPSDNVYLGDLDGDGYPDLTIAHLGLTATGLPPERHAVYYNTEGTPSTTADWRSAPGNAFSCDGGDPDGDGDIDIAFGQGDRLTDHFQHAVLYVNEGGAFDSVPGWESDSVYYGTEVDFADIDLDGDMDLALGAATFGVAVFYNNGGALETAASWQTNAILAGRQMAFGDVDGDGYPDLAVAGGHESFFLFRNLNGVLEDTPSWSTGGAYQEPSAVAWADADADGDLDLAAGGWLSPVGVFENVEGTLTQTLAWSYPAGGVQQIRWADFDEDGLKDTVEVFVSDGSRKLFYLGRRPLHEISSVEHNGTPLGLGVYCYDLMDGWLSLGFLPSAGDTLEVSYTYSLDLDLAVTDYQYVRVFENQILLPPYIVPSFEADPTTGHAPLTIQFSDASVADPPVTWWAWDFNNDGTPDSHAQNPSWVYGAPGHYTVRLEVASASVMESLVSEDYIRVFNGQSALEFDADESYVTCAASATLNLTEALTIEAWINPAGWGEAGVAGYGRIVDKGSFALYLNGQSGTFAPHSLVFMLKNETGPPKLAWTPDSSLVTGSWQHVAATYEATSGELKLYIAGIDQNVYQTSPPSGPIRGNADIELLIGNSGGYINTFDGVIDEVRVWNVARSTESIRSNMNVHLQGTEEGLVGYWAMDEGGGAVVTDGSGNGNAGTVSGAIWTEGYEAATDAGEGLYPASSPQRCRILGVDPNPFSQAATIQLSIPVESSAEVSLYDICGRRVRTLLSGRHSPGTQVIEWNGTAEDGTTVGNGVYLCRLKANGSAASRRMVLVR